MTGASLSGLYDAPILITEGNDVLEESVKSRIKALNASNVIIIGGASAIPASIENELKASYNVTRLAGLNDSSTAVANHVIKNSAEKVDTAFLVNSSAFADALSISPVSAVGKYPIFFTNGSSITAETRNTLISGKIKNIVIIGGEGVITSNLANALTSLGLNVKRIAGFNRYTTCTAVYNEYKAMFGNDFSVATGENYPDALAGGAFAAKNKTALMLTADGNVPSEIASTIKGNANTKKLYLIGGEGVIPENSIRMIYA